MIQYHPDAIQGLGRRLVSSPKIQALLTANRIRHKPRHTGLLFMGRPAMRSRLPPLRSTRATTLLSCIPRAPPIVIPIAHLMRITIT